MLIIFEILSGVLFLGCLFLLLIVVGFMRTEKFIYENYKEKSLTGVEIEEIRRKLIVTGINGLSHSDVFNLIYTIRQIFIGNYQDNNPYLPPDYYDDYKKKTNEL